MTYHVDIAPSAQKELASLPKKMVQRISAAVEDLADNPRPRGCLKLEGEEDLYRIRVGKYRVVYEIVDKRILVYVVRIRHRKDAY